MLILVITLLMASEIRSFDYPKEPTEKWKKLTDTEQYQLFVEINIQYDYLLEQYHRQKKLSNIQLDRINILVNEIKRLQKDKFKYGVSWGLSAGLDNMLNVDVEFISNFYIIFLKRFFLSPAFSIKFYKNIGGNISFSVGFLW